MADHVAAVPPSVLVSVQVPVVPAGVGAVVEPIENFVEGSAPPCSKTAMPPQVNMPVVPLPT